MSKKTLALVAGLTVLTLVLVVLALNTGQKAPSQPGQQTSSPTPTVPAHTSVRLSPEPVTLTGGTATVSVLINTADNADTGAQFDVIYDPKALTVSPMKKGDFFNTNSIELLNDTKTPGKVTYMIGLTPAGMNNPRSGTGTIATFTVTRKAGATGSTTLGLENVYISAKGLKPSVLKSATGTTVMLSTGTNSPASSSGR